MMSAVPELSIVATIIDGGQELRAFLHALARLEDAPSLEIIVPFDDTCPEIPALRTEFPEVTFLDLGHVQTIHPVSTEAGRHELYDRRRARGLAASRGRIVAILEDRGRPRPDWARQVVRLHAQTGCPVVGGAIECREPANALNWAFYVTDFGRYGLPFESGPAEWVSDVNVSYSRAALEEMRPLWVERYHEPILHGYLRKKGERLWLSAEMVVEHGRPPVSLGYLLAERFHWGRLFGHIRTMTIGEAERWRLILGAPLIPPLLWLRHGVIQTRKGRGVRYLRALPHVMALTTAWTLGEVWGYVTRRP